MPAALCREGGAKATALEKKKGKKRGMHEEKID